MNLLSKQKFHFVGVGGIGMSGLAHLLLKKGCRVSGSDVKDSSLLSRLRKEGAILSMGHREENVKDAEVLVYSSCIPPENSERREALRRGLLLLSRGELLSHLFQEKRIGIAISGSHGKTTTTALATWLLKKGGLDPTYFIGGVSRNLGDHAGEGKGDYFVTEADESDGSFLALSPTYTLVTNMDAEHLDYYKTLESSLEAYALFLNKTEKEGKVFISSDCPNTSKTLKKVTHPHPITFGFSRTAHYFPDRIERLGEFSSFDCVGNGKRIGSFRLPLSGRHNVLNAVSVIALGVELGIPSPVIQEAIESFRGVERRLEIRKFASLTIVEDYAHHPTEIEATLEALRGMADGRRIVGVFQPHRYTRTQLLAEAFGNCFEALDVLILTDIYAASEEPIPGIDGETILKTVQKKGKNKHLFFLPQEEILPHLLEFLRPDDILIVMGAGDINEIAKELARLCSEGAFSWIRAS